MSHPRTSVAVCTYNGEKFVRAQLDSIAAQSQPVTEVIVCDDGSTDGTLQHVHAFARSAGFPVHLHRNPDRLGVTRNFEKAISLCTGELVFLCDQDDLWRPDKVARLSACFNDPAIGLAFSNAQVVNEDLSPAGYRLWDSVWFTPGERVRVAAGDAVPVLLRHAVAAGSTLAFRSALRPLLLPIPDFPHSHDIWIALVSACVARLCPVDEDLIRYRLHASNTVGLKNHNLLSQIRMARWQLKTNQFRVNAEMCQAAVERLRAGSAEGGSANDAGLASSMALLREKIAHLRARDTMPRFWPARLPVVARELARGRYARYSYGYKSVLQDLFLR